MTYTFKLSRRLAVSRNAVDLLMLPALLLFVACSGGDTTAPDGSPADAAQWRPRDLIPVAVRVNPSSITIETNQLIHFRAHGRTKAGDSVAAAVTWSTTGGTILPDGRFSAATIGTYSVIGRNHTRGSVQFDSSVVVVIRRQLKLASVHISPGTASLTSGASQTFTAVGRHRNGTLVPIGVNWSATGGTIDDGGTYVAGDTAGTYQVIAVNTAGTLADTALVSITAAPSPPPPSPPPPPPPPPEPVLEKLTLLPATATLAPATKLQLKAYGTTTAGDSVAVSVVFAASGGTVTSAGLYTAGPSAGTFRVIASSGPVADTSTITVKAPLGSATPASFPYGPFDLFQSWTRVATPGFTGTVSYVSPSGILQLLSSMRANRVSGFLKLTGDAHSTYITAGQFDIAKWKAATARYDTPEIKTAVAQAVQDGILLGYSMIDEPNHYSWGGVITKAVIDEMAMFSKSIFPTLPTAAVAPYKWRGAERYKVLDVIIAGTWKETGTSTAWRDAAVEAAKLNGVALAPVLNILGAAVTPGCLPRPGGGDTCVLTPAEIRDWAITLGTDPYTCGMFMWRFDATLWGMPEYLAAFKDVSTALAKKPVKSCRRP
jgi:hypothetical protein